MDNNINPEIKGGKSAMYPSEIVLEMTNKNRLNLTADMMNTFQDYIQLKSDDKLLSRIQRVCVDMIDAVERQRTYIKCDTLTVSQQPLG